jgi:hypothetical protein
MLSESLAFNRKLVKDAVLYRYPLWDADGDGVDMTCYVEIDNEKIPRRGDCYPVYEVPEGKLVLLDQFAWWPSGEASTETIAGGSIGRVTLEGGYHITLNAAARSLHTQHVTLARPVPYFAGEWIGMCPHLEGRLEPCAFRITLRFRECPTPPGAVAGRRESLPRAT